MTGLFKIVCKASLKWLGLISIGLLLTVSNAFGQNYGDPEYYLIDSIDLDLLGENDRIVLDTNLSKFHEAKHDTDRIRYVNQIINGCWNEKVWPRYNAYMENWCREKLKHKHSQQEERLYMGYHSDALNNQGLLEYTKGRLHHALELYHESLAISEKLNNVKSISATLSNITLINMDMRDYKEALKTSNRCFNLLKTSGVEKSYAVLYNNYGVIYNGLDSVELSLKYYHKSLQEYEKNNNVVNASTALYNIASVFEQKLNNEDSALFYLHKSLDILGEKEYYPNLALVNTELARIYLRQGKTDSALVLAQKGYQEAVETKYPSRIFRSALILSQTLRSIADKTTDVQRKSDFLQKSLDYYTEYVQMKDSAVATDRRKSLYQLEAKYEYEKQRELDQIKHLKEIEIEKHTENIQLLIIIFSLFALVVVVLFLILNTRRLRQSKAQNQIIQAQKYQVDEKNDALNKTNEEIRSQHAQLKIQRKALEQKNHEITENISYARKLQQNLLPRFDQVQELFPQSFLMHKPRDIVSGDFFWVEQKGTKIWLAVADCTGHGVSGALLTVVCSRILHETLKKKEDWQPAAFLTEVDKQVLLRLENEQDTFDGMDISLCVIDMDQKLLEFSGAHNNALIVRNGEKTELTATSRPVGFAFSNYEYPPFEQMQIQFEKGDKLYLYTDGYQDQFGGENGRKFFSIRFEELLIRTGSLGLKEQQSLLESELEAWKGNQEQIDDITVMGIQL